LSEYYVEQVNKKTMIEFLQVKEYRRQVIAKHFDSKTEGVDCRSTDSILCDWCMVSLRRPRAPGQEHKESTDKCRNKMDSKIRQEASNEIRGSEMIAGKLQELVEADKLVF
jgi:hypothetical protein